MLRGWIGPSRYLSKRKQRKLLVDAGVDERVIYLGENEWPAFVKALRPGTNDKAAVADLRVFGSRRGLLAAAEAVEARGAVLVVAETGTSIDMPTLREIDRTLHRWRGEAAIKTGKRASAMGKRGAEARKKSVAAARLDKEAARAIWSDEKRYPDAADALDHMPGWTRTTAWRHFGPREIVNRKN
jgi:hypothetical protein